jgi:hypothetical protein
MCAATDMSAYQRRGEVGGGAVCVCVCMQYIHDVCACHVYVYSCVYVCMQEEGVDALGLVVRVIFTAGIFTAGIFPPILF